MGAVELAARAIEAFAWPLTLVVLLLVFRSSVHRILHRLSERIDDLRSLRGPGIEADFDARVLEMREDAKALGVPSKADEQQPSVPAPDPIDLGDVEDFDVENLALRAEKYPRDLIIDSWLYLEQALREAGHHLGIAQADKMPIVRVLARLSDAANQWQVTNAIPVIHELRILRNDLVHKRGITLSSLAAYDYAVTAIGIAQVLKRLPSVPAPRGGNEEL